jgi:Fe2+ or Zn2+ uptake regulation protein
VCLRCGNIRDLDDLTTREILEKVAAVAEFAATGQRLDIYGVCQKCGSPKSVTPSTNKKH